MLPLLGIIIGLIIGLFLDIDIPAVYSPYVAVLILAALDSLVGALLASLQKKFNTLLFVTGLLGNGLIAVVLSALGDRLNIDLNLAAIFAFGVRIINNFSQVRRFWLQQFSERRRLARQMKDVVDAGIENDFLESPMEQINDIPLSLEEYAAAMPRDRVVTLEQEILDRVMELEQIKQELNMIDSILPSTDHESDQ